MTRPADIPQDVWQAAQLQIAGPLPAGDVEAGDRVAHWAEVHVARAIIAERERCAKAVEAWRTDGDFAATFAVLRSEIAAALRKGASA